MSADEKVRIGILGCANIARKYAIKAFQSIPNAELVSIASRDPQKAKEWAAEFGIRAEDSYESLLQNKEIDAVYIPLPVGLHEEWVIKAAQAGKHIICEKSLTGSFESAAKMIKECRSKGVVLYENFMCDFHPQHAKVMSLLADGEIGEPIVFQSWYGFPLFQKDNIRYQKELGGGSLNDVGTYTAFMVRKIFDKEPESVSCKLIYDSATDVDMRGSILMEFPSGESALMAFGYGMAYQNRYSVWGGGGIIDVGVAYSIPPEREPIIQVIKIENYKEVAEDIRVSAANQFELIFEDFCNTVLQKDILGDAIESRYEKILMQARVMEALRISADEDRKVRIGEVN